MKNVLAKKYGDQVRWVNWRPETRKGKTTKIPYTPGTNRMASSTDPKTWTTYADAILAESGKNVGIVFTPDQLLLGIDIDHCIEGDKIVHVEKKAIRELLKLANTYTELSPSAHGLHLYLELTAPLPLTANRHGNFEAYTSGRYFTVTGIPFGASKDVRTVTPEEALELLMIIGYPWGKEEELLGKEMKIDFSEAQPNDKVIKGDGHKLFSKGNYLDDDLLKKIFKSKNGPAIRKLYDGDISAHKKDGSAADMALLSHLAFWTIKDPVQMERIWLASPLGSRKKTIERADYRARSIKNAIARCDKTYKTPIERMNEESDSEIEFLVMKGAKGEDVVIQNTENICRVLREHPMFSATLRFDAFRNIFERKTDNEWHPFEDSEAVDIQTSISILFSCFRKVGKEMVFDAIVKVSKENSYDSAADFIRGIKWDGKARLDHWLEETYGTPDDEYHRKIASNWVKGMVKRIIEPGCKFDYVLVLEGEQGIRKSTSLSVLAGEELGHVETTMSTDSKDFFMQFQGKAIIEFSEGETLSRTEVKRMKAIITVQSDKYRPPYGRVSVDNPRRCVFAMTTNQEEYLKDETGNRRWLPVRVFGNANTEWLEKNRLQLLAEAYKRVIVDHETTYEFPEEEMVAAQNERRVHDPNYERIVDWFFGELHDFERKKGITVHQVYQFCYNGGMTITRPITRYEEMSIADVLRSILKLERQQNMRDGIRASRWFMTDKTPKPDNVEIPFVPEEVGREV